MPSLHTGWWVMVVLVVLVVLLHLVTATADPSHKRKWTRDFAVEIDGLTPKEAELAVGIYGFHIVRHLDVLGNVYHIRHKRSCGKQFCSSPDEDLLRLLKANPYVKSVEQQEVLPNTLKRQRSQPGDDEPVPENVKVIDMLDKKYSRLDDEYVVEVLKRERKTSFVTFNDPGWDQQWQIHNSGQFGTKPGLDMNLKNLYARDYRGQGVAISVVDDGLDTENPDIKGSYDPIASIDLNDPSDEEGNPRGPEEIIPQKDSHGTSVGGEIAGVANNSFCGVGVAHKSNLGGIRMLAGAVTDLMEAYALTYNPHYIQIYSNSWGPPDDGKLMKMPNKYLGLAFKVGTEKGRNGKGTIFAFASGNGGHGGDSCGADGYVNSPYTISFTSVNIHGENARYDEHCSALAVTMPVGGYHSIMEAGSRDPKVITAAINGGCNTKFVGTSAATPLGAACIGLGLQANPELSWRDVQHMLVYAARLPNRHQQVWQRNGAGHHVSHYYGFGMLDCAQMVRQAQKWRNVGPQHNCTVGSMQKDVPIFAGQKSRFVFHCDNCEDSAKNRVDRAEHVLVHAVWKHERRGDLSFWLTSPAGTISPLLLNRPRDDLAVRSEMTFMTRMSWDENPRGEWIFEVADSGAHAAGDGEGDPPAAGTKRGVIYEATMHVLGTAGTDVHPKMPLGEPKNKPAYQMSLDEVAQTFHEERERFLRELPEHRKVFEMQKKLNGVKKLDEKLKSEITEILRDQHVPEEDVHELKKSLARFHFSSS